MKLETIPRTELAGVLGLVDASGKTSERAVAGLLRASLARWGLSPRRAVLEHARSQLRAAKIEDVSIVRAVLQRLIALGECDQVHVGHEVYVAPAEPRWIWVGDSTAVYLGVAGPPVDASSLASADSHDIVQRVRLDTEDAALLAVEGAREVSLAEWFRPADYLRHADRRRREPVRGDTFTLSRFWDLLTVTLGNEGLPVGADAELRALTGTPGQFFGRYDASECEGRWTADPSRGVWCAYRRGYGEAHWHPIILAVEDGVRRALDLYDHDEWRWSVLARGMRRGAEEVIRTEQQRVQLTFFPPSQLGTALDLLGSRSGAWTWELSPGAPAVWEILV